jgi:mannose-6-phosphate isomerase-like protein (cupin superfamily)
MADNESLTSIACRSNELNFLATYLFQRGRAEHQVMFFRQAATVFPDILDLFKILDTQNDQISTFHPEKDAKPRVFVALRANVDPIISSIEQQYQRACPDCSSFSSHLYYGDSTSASLGVHTDYVDVLFWQVYGSTTWSVPVENSKNMRDDPLIHSRDYVLQPGDMIYVPRAVAHKVVSHGERISISFGADNKDYWRLMPLSVKKRILTRNVKSGKITQEEMDTYIRNHVDVFTGM